MEGIHKMEDLKQEAIYKQFNFKYLNVLWAS